MIALRSAHWFGLTLVALLLFLWCVVSAAETGLHAGWIWGICVFGLIAIFAAIMALVQFFGEGGQVDHRDRLTRTQPSAPPRSGSGRGWADTGYRPRGQGEVPRPSSGRNIDGSWDG